jgi:hypothetical protein
VIHPQTKVFGFLTYKALIKFSIELPKFLFRKKNDINEKKNLLTHFPVDSTMWAGMCGICKVLKYHGISALKK